MELHKKKTLKKIHYKIVHFRKEFLIHHNRKKAKNIKKKVRFNILISNLYSILTYYPFKIKRSIKTFHNIQKSRENKSIDIKRIKSPYLVFIAFFFIESSN